MSATDATDAARIDALLSAVRVLRRAADSTFPPDLDRRFLDLGERRDGLTPDERAELLAWVAFTQQRSINSAEARVVLRRLAFIFPEIVTASGAA